MCDKFDGMNQLSSIKYELVLQALVVLITNVKPVNVNQVKNFLAGPSDVSVLNAVVRDLAHTKKSRCSDQRGHSSTVSWM